MSTTSTPADSPIHVQALHNPAQAAHVVVPQAPLGNATNGPLSNAPGMGAKALLAKKMAKNSNPTYISPTDNLMTPCTQKISAAKKKHFNKGPKPMQKLAFGQNPVKEDASSSSEEDQVTTEAQPAQGDEMKVDDEDNPF